MAAPCLLMEYHRVYGYYARHDRLKARHWQPILRFIETSDHRAGEVILTMKNAVGNPFANIGMTGALRRLAVANSDFVLHFKYDRMQYRAYIHLKGRGQWGIVVSVDGGGYDEPYRLEKRVWVK